MRSIPFSPLVPVGALLAAMAGGCSSAGYEAFGPPAARVPGVESFAPTLTASDATPAAADPSLPGFDGWPLVFVASAPGTVAYDCALEVRRGDTILAELEGTLDEGLCTARWDGLEAGAPAAPGPLSVEAHLVRPDGTVRATAVQTLEVVRLGVDRIELEVEAGARSPLLYRSTAGRRGDFSELSATEAPFAMAADASETGASAIELASGARRATPTPWNDILTPPLDASDPDGVEADTFDLPSAIVAGSDVRLVARIATEAAGGVSGDAVNAEVRLVASVGDAALTVSGEDVVRHGNLITLEHGSSPVPAVGRFDVTYRFAFEARRMGGAFQPVPGALEITLRYYGLAAPPVFYGAAVPHRPWVDVLDRIAEWVNGESAEPDAVGARLVEGVYYELGLRYDTARGASHYTDYGAGFDGATFEMQAFEERDYGSVINCSDAASILSAYANMVGLDFRYHILRHRTEGSFDLNFIQAIGGTEFDEFPFDSGRGEFSYHAIVGARDGTSWDGTLAIDGDGTPTSLPSTLQLVQQMAPLDYLTALSSEPAQIRTTHDDRVRIR